MNEKHFSSEISRSLRKDKIWYYKIPDIGQTLKPFDRVIEYNSMLIGIEEKLTKEHIFYFSKVRPQQWINLKDIRFGYLLINYRYKKVNRAFLIHSWIAYALNNLSPSLTLEECEGEKGDLLDIIEVKREGRYWKLIDAIKEIITNEE